MFLSLTLDYELYGNGPGNVFKDVIEPTNNLLSICDIYGIKITIFFEVVEYWKLKEGSESGNKMGYSSNPAEAMKQQMIEAYKSGHDIQLHIHPQWVGAKYIDGKWKLNSNYWRLPDVPTKSKNNEINLRGLLKNGKETLENILKPIDKNYECKIIRAGGFNIFPSNKILPIMREVRLKADSSVFAGGCTDNDFSSYDYRSIDGKNPYWFTSTGNILDIDIGQDGKEKIYEFPVFSFPVRRYRKYELSRLILKLRNRSSIKTTINQANSKTKSKSVLGKFKFFFEKEAITWDYCLFSFRKMKHFFNKAAEIEKESNYKFHPFILIGHSKEFFCQKRFEKFIRYSLKKQTTYLTLNRILKKLEENNELYD